ncbi:MAG TPA: alkaline phosphatase family protein [Candidatus Kryptonia bacterium]|nr:alkaline phosphatase family protein [Candidatus Kryptonia bacterium]
MKTALAFVLAAIALAAACSNPPAAKSAHRVLVLGFDGIDPGLLDRFMATGALPNFARLAATGSYIHLGTTIPPQSPVAWSTFITGLDPGGHGIYDFVHRDPAPPGGGAIAPFLSTSRVEEDERRLTFGRYALPLSSGTSELLRHGKAFWNVLAEHGVPATVLKIPANFPPEPSTERTLSDMGTPDLRGTYGTFSFYSSDPADGGDHSVSGGLFHTVQVADHHVHAELPGPTNPFLSGAQRATREFNVFIDDESDAVKLEIGDQALVLQTGEWSGWVPVTFDLVPGLVGVHGIVRFHLVQARPHLRLYSSPVNIAPEQPALPISTPPDYASDLFAHVGSFYTQGLPENTAALTAAVLDDSTWLAHANDIFNERLGMFEFELGRFRSGLLFAYFGGTDQVAHMFWREMEQGAEAAHSDAILNTYRQVDGVLGRALAAIAGDSDTTLIVMSDHGFAPFSRAVHLNSWLRSEGFLALRPGVEVGGELYRDIDWARTRAYGLGLNGLYLNLEGRERFGIVGAAARESLLSDLTARLLAWRDPQNHSPIVSRVYRREEVYSSKYRDLAPDLIVGYARGYRVSNESALGEVPAVLIEDNRKKWSGDHCMAADQVPGVLLSNRRGAAGGASLQDIAPTVLSEFGIPAPQEMVGKSILHGGG